MAVSISLGHVGPQLWRPEPVAEQREQDGCRTHWGLQPQCRQRGLPWRWCTDTQRNLGVYIYIYIHILTFMYIVNHWYLHILYIYIYMCVCVCVCTDNLYMLIRCSHHILIPHFQGGGRHIWRPMGLCARIVGVLLFVLMPVGCNEISVCRLLTVRQSPPPFSWTLDWIDWRRATIWVPSRFVN